MGEFLFNLAIQRASGASDLPNPHHFNAIDPIVVVDRFSKIRQFGGMKPRILIAVIVAFVIGISAGGAGRNFIASDRCLDRVGAWDADPNACDLQRGNGR